MGVCLPSSSMLKLSCQTVSAQPRTHGKCCVHQRRAEGISDPPTLFVPLPTLISMIPPRPDVDAPVPISIAPLLLATDVPELKTSIPLAPLVPELMERIVMAPLDVAVPSPLIM